MPDENTPVMNCPSIINADTFWYIPINKKVKATICNKNAKLIANLLPFVSANAGRPSIPSTAPNGYIDCMIDLIDFF